jgi:hypothetical protein
MRPLSPPLAPISALFAVTSATDIGDHPSNMPPKRTVVGRASMEAGNEQFILAD